MLRPVVEILLEAKNVYLKNFRGLSLYLIFVSAASFFISLVASLPLVLAGSNIFFVLFGVLLLFIAPFVYFKIMIGFQFQLRNALQKEKLAPLRQTLSQPNSLVFTALGSSILSGFISLFPITLGALGLAIQNKNTFFPWLQNTLQFPEAASLPTIEIHGVLGYFFLLLCIYGIFHLFYFSTVLSMSYYSVLFDKKNVAESLEKSMSLVKGRWWQVWWRFFVPTAIFFFLYGILLLVSYGLQKQFGTRVGETVEFFVSIFLNFFAVIPLAYLPALIIFDELMKKQEKK